MKKFKKVINNCHISTKIFVLSDFNSILKEKIRKDVFKISEIKDMNVKNKIRFI